MYHYGLLQRSVRPTRQRPSLPSAAVSTRRCALSNICDHLSFAPVALTEPQPGCYCCRGSRQSTTPLYHECAAHLIAHRSAETPGCRSRHDREPISRTFLSFKRRIIYNQLQSCVHTYHAMIVVLVRLAAACAACDSMVERILLVKEHMLTDSLCCRHLTRLLP